MNLLMAELELAAWRRARKCALIWWRDDDARTWTPELDRLVALSTHFGAPLTLAVVPDGRLEAIAQKIAGNANIAIAQHGLHHVNRARPGRPASEILDTDTMEEVAEMVAAGARRLRDVPGRIDLYVPPFNQADAPLTEALQTLGVQALSAWGGLSTRDGRVARIDTHFEVLRWRGGPRFKGHWKLTAKLAAELRKRRRAGAWDEPIGFQTHHLDHDPQSWAFIEQFLLRLQAEPAAKMVDVRTLFKAKFDADLVARADAPAVYLP